jgi:hypothetical protein
MVINGCQVLISSVKVIVYGLQVLDTLGMFGCTIFVGVERQLGKERGKEQSKQNKVRKRCLQNE